MIKRVLVVLAAIIVVAVIWMARNDNKDDERSFEGPEQRSSAGQVTGMSPGSEVPGNVGETVVLPARPPEPPDAAMLPGSLAGPDEVTSMAPEDSTGPLNLPSMGQAPEASDSGYMGLPPETGGTGVPGLPPESGQPTDPGLPPEVSDSGSPGPAPEEGGPN